MRNQISRKYINIKKLQIGGLSTIGVNKVDVKQTENSTIKQFNPPPLSDIKYHKINDRFKSKQNI